MRLHRAINALRLVLPYAVTTARRRRLRSLLLAGSVAAGILIYLLFAGHMNAYRGVAVRKADSLAMPVDAIALYREGAPLGELAMSVHVDRVTPAAQIWVFGQWGLLPAVGLPQGAEPWTNIPLVSGRVPDSPGEVILPQGQGFPSSGSAGITHILPNGLVREATWEVVGVYDARALPFSYPLTTLNTVETLGGIAANMAWIGFYDSGNPNAASHVGRIGRPVQFLHPDTASGQAALLVSDVYGPYRTVIFMVFILSGMGVLNVMLLGFLERRKSLGIMKAQGLQSHEMMMLLLSEAVATSLAGIVAGTGGGLVLVSLVRNWSGLGLYLTVLDVVAAGMIAMIVACLGAYVPARMSQGATVLDLISGR